MGLIKSAHVDKIGMTASTLCAIHCAIVPVLFTSLPLVGLGFLTRPWIEWSMIIVAAGIGFYAISNGIATHRNLRPMVFLIAGFLVIFVGHAFIKGWPEAVIVPCGGLMIAFSHFLNYKLIGQCKTGRRQLVHNQKNTLSPLTQH